MKKLVALLNCIIMLICISCSRTEYFLSSAFTVNIKDGNVKKAEELSKDLDAFESVISNRIITSDVFAINNAKAGETVAISDVTRKLFELSSELYEITQGEFNIALYPITKLWGFDNGNYHIPTEEELSSVMQYCKLEDFTLTDNTISKKYTESMLDFGGIAKGYILGEITEKAQTFVVDGILNLAGNVAIIGDNKQQGFRVGLVHPRAIEVGEKYIDILNLSNCYASTTSDSERFFETNGKRYCHILSGTTGNQVDTDILSVTVISSDLLPQNSTLADAYSTYLYILGTDKAIEFANNCNLKIIITDKNYKVIKNFE